MLPKLWFSNFLLHYVVIIKIRKCKIKIKIRNIKTMPQDGDLKWNFQMVALKRLIMYIVTFLLHPFVTPNTHLYTHILHMTN